MPPSEITPTSVVPPPMSTTMEPEASDTGRPAPMPAAMGSSIRYTAVAPAASAASLMARRSTWVEPQGTQMMMRGLGVSTERGCTILMNCLIICSVITKSAITPSFIGRMASMLPGTLPSMALASWPTAWITFLPWGPPSWRMATTEGSSRTMPLSRAKMRVLAVPRSMARSVEKYRRKAPNIQKSSQARHARRPAVAGCVREWVGGKYRFFRAMTG